MTGRKLKPLPERLDELARLCEMVAEWKVDAALRGRDINDRVGLAGSAVELFDRADRLRARSATLASGSVEE